MATPQLQAQPSLQQCCCWEPRLLLLLVLQLLAAVLHEQQACWCRVPHVREVLPWSESLAQRQGQLVQQAAGLAALLQAPWGQLAVQAEERLVHPAPAHGLQ